MKNRDSVFSWQSALVGVVKLLILVAAAWLALDRKVNAQNDKLDRVCKDVIAVSEFSVENRERVAAVEGDIKAIATSIKAINTDLNRMANGLDARPESGEAGVRRVRYRRRRTARAGEERPPRVGTYYEGAWDAEPGDLMVGADGELFRLEESSAETHKKPGELYARKITPPADGARAVIDSGEVYWEIPER